MNLDELPDAVEKEWKRLNDAHRDAARANLEAMSGKPDADQAETSLPTVADAVRNELRKLSQDAP